MGNKAGKRLKGSDDGLNTDLRTFLDAMREELDEHLDSINDNTSEQQIQNDQICELDNRIAKVEERMDEIKLMLERIARTAELSIRLTREEQRMFLMLYTNDNFISTLEIASRMDLEDDEAGYILESMMDKGVPIEREIIEGRMFFRMDKDFKLRQAKESIISIDPEVTRQYQNTLLKQFFETD